jgi:hypothetical protein
MTSLKAGLPNESNILQDINFAKTSLEKGLKILSLEFSQQFAN